jgi:ABC-type transport system substrate-binding protein
MIRFNVDKYTVKRYLRKLLIIAIIFNVVFFGFLYLLTMPYQDGWPPPPPPITHLVFGTTTYPTDIDPHLCYDSCSGDVIYQICEGLYKFDTTHPSYPLLPILARELPMVTNDSLNITISLRSGVTFQDGTPFNAIAVKWNFDRLNFFLNYSGNKFLPAPFNISLNSTQKVSKSASLFTSNDIPIMNRTEIVDTYTIRIILNRPKASFINLLTFYAAFFHSPTSAIAQGKELDHLTYNDNNTLIGTGPFKLQNYDTDIQIKFTGYEDYWQYPASLGKITFVIIEDDNILNNAVLAGDVDLIIDPNPAFFNQFRADPDIRLLEAGPTLNISYMGFNGYMVNRSFRKAISYAINYSHIIDVILLGEAYRLRSPIPFGIPMSNSFLNYPTFNRTYAQSILKSMGYGIGFTSDTQWLTVADSGGWGFGWNITAQTEGTIQRDVALYISDNLKYLGINASVVQIPFQDIVFCMKNDTGPLRRSLIPMYIYGRVPDYIDPENCITPLYSNSSAIWVNTWDHELEILILEGETTGDIVARQVIYNQIQQKLVEELYFSVWLFAEKNYDVMQNYVHGWVPNAIGRLDLYPIYLA